MIATWPAKRAVGGHLMMHTFNAETQRPQRFAKAHREAVLSYVSAFLCGRGVSALSVGDGACGVRSSGPLSCPTKCSDSC